MEVLCNNTRRILQKSRGKPWYPRQQSEKVVRTLLYLSREPLFSLVVDTILFGHDPPFHSTLVTVIGFPASIQEAKPSPQTTYDMMDLGCN